jgi:hypothetical protein
MPTTEHECGQSKAESLVTVAEKVSIMRVGDTGIIVGKMFRFGIGNSVLVLSETELVIAIERNGRRDESGTESQTGASCLDADSNGDEVRKYLRIENGVRLVIQGQPWHPRAAIRRRTSMCGNRATAGGEIG